VFKCIIDIKNAIVHQISDKHAVIPFAIKQFCKVLYTEARKKFPQTPPKVTLALVTEYLMSEWLLKAMLIEPHLEGIMREF